MHFLRSFGIAALFLGAITVVLNLAFIAAAIYVIVWVLRYLHILPMA